MTDRRLAPSAADTFMYDEAAAQAGSGPARPGRTGPPGTGRARAAWHDHQQVQRRRLDHAGRLLAADGEDVDILGAERDEQRLRRGIESEPERSEPESPRPAGGGN